MRYYRLDTILKKNARYNIIFGERSNGKTFAVLEYGLKRYLNGGGQLAIIRRWREDFRGVRGAQMFESLCKTGTGENLIKKYTKGKYDTVHYYSGRWYLANYDEELDRKIPASQPFAVGFALTEMEHTKSTSYPDITTVLFDEFLTRGSYLPDEFVLFMNTLSTIIRERDNVKIFMLANTVNKFCPYFSEMGLKNIQKMQKGDIDVYKYGNSGLIVAVEYADNLNKKKPSSVYFAFNNNNLKLNMITSGDWELDIYPHNTRHYEKKDIIFTYFIVFEDNLLQCDIVVLNDDMFTFVHKKTTDIKDTNKDLIYDITYHQQRNYRRNILKPYDQIGKRLLWFYQSDNVYYQDNEIGDLVNNYLNWCKQAK